MAPRGSRRGGDLSRLRNSACSASGRAWRDGAGRCSRRAISSRWAPCGSGSRPAAGGGSCRAGRPRPRGFRRPSPKPRAHAARRLARCRDRRRNPASPADCRGAGARWCSGAPACRCGAARSSACHASPDRHAYDCNGTDSTRAQHGGETIAGAAVQIAQEGLGLRVAMGPVADIGDFPAVGEPEAADVDGVAEGMFGQPRPDLVVHQRQLYEPIDLISTTSGRNAPAPPAGPPRASQSSARDHRTVERLGGVEHHRAALQRRHFQRPGQAADRWAVDFMRRRLDVGTKATRWRAKQVSSACCARPDAGRARISSIRRGCRARSASKRRDKPRRAMARFLRRQR